jgi:Gram-negative bacterial TonB protein C-terminal
MFFRLLLAGALLVAAAPGVWAIDDSTSQELLNSVLIQHNFIQAAPAPFVLEAEFTGQANVAMQGRLRLRWQSKDHWWTRVDFGPFQQIRVRNGEMEYTSRNYEFTPLQVIDLYSLVGIDEDLPSFPVKKMANRIEAGLSMVCLLGRPDGSTKIDHEFCADSSSRDLLNESWSPASEQSRRRHFADYVEANGVRYPGRLEMYMNSSKMISAHITEFKPMPFDPKLLEPPSGAIERRKCLDLKQPIPIRKIKQEEVRFGNRPWIGQEVLVMTILTDGSPSDIHVVQSGGSNYDKTAVEAFSDWKFKPAMCGNEAVIQDFMVELNYRTLALRRPGRR